MRSKSMLDDIPELKQANKVIKEAQKLMSHPEGIEAADLAIEN